MDKQPLVSIIMSVYNAQHYLKEAIESILNQTYSNFEFFIINDGSTDESLSIIQLYNDPRIILINRENKGLIYSLNEALSLAKGKYIARQDADDFSNINRIYKQVEYLENHKQIFLVGTFAKIVDQNGNYAEQIKPPTMVKKEHFLRFNPFVHGSIMLKRDVLKYFNNWYDKSMLYIEDYDFFWRICSVYQCSNIDDFLYFWRKHEDNISIKKVELQVQNKYLRRLLYQKKVTSMNIYELNKMQKREMLGMINNNKGHYYLRQKNNNAIKMYAKSLLIYPSIKSLAFLILSIFSPKLLLRIIS